MKKKTELRLYLQTEPFSLDPRIGIDHRSQTVLKLLFDGLMRLGKGGKPEPALASSYSLSSDKTIYTFRLRETTWSNGERVEAQDFVSAWKSVIEGSLPFSFMYAFSVIKNATIAFQKLCPPDDIGIRAVDRTTLEVTLERPTPHFLELLTTPLFSPIYPQMLQDNSWDSTTFPQYISNGPYVLKTRTPTFIVLERNPHHEAQENLPYHRITFSIVDDPSTAFNMFQQQSLDWHGDPCGTPSLKALFNGSTETHFHTEMARSSFWLLNNQTDPLLNSPKIRKAISCSINRYDICSNIFQNRATLSFSVLPKALSLLKHSTAENHNPPLARSLFMEGMKELHLPSAPPPSITITYWNDPIVSTIVKNIQLNIHSALPLRVVLQPLSWKECLERYLKGDFQMVALFWFPCTPSTLCTLNMFKETKNGINTTSWNNPRFSQLLEASPTSEQTACDIIREAETIIMRELPVIPIFEQPFTYVMPPKESEEKITSLFMK